MNDKAKWTFMVYLAGDNNLSAAGGTDLEEMRSIGSTDAVNIIAEFDNEGEKGTNRYHVKSGENLEPVVSLGETDSGDPEVLIDFIRWSAQNYPAERYALVLWNHGGGWEPSEMDRLARPVGAADYSEREASERSSSPLGRMFFRTSLEKIFRLPSVEERAICSDDGTGHSLDTIELGNVLSRTVEFLGQPIDLLGMDACLMSNLEVAYQAKPYVKTIVASEENEPNNGWPYDTVLRALVDEPDIETPAFARHIVNAYVNYYVERNYSGAVTQASLDTAQVSIVTGPLNDLSEALIQHMPNARYEIGEALYATTAKFWHNTLWDVAQFCEELSKITTADSVRQAAESVRSALQPQDDRLVIAEAHNGAKVSRCGGVTIYIPPRILHRISPYYADLSFAGDHSWLSMLEAYHGA